MDLLRRCYTTEMRFFKDNPLEIKVRWYWCADQAEIFPFHTRFGSGNWASERFDWPGPGEVLGAARPWNDGHFIDGMLGDHHCGPDTTYREGGIYPGVPLNGLPDGRCACCAPVPTPCVDFVQGLPATLRCRILNITLIPDDAPPSNYVIGQEFDFTGTGGPNPAWISSVPFSRDACPFVDFVTLECIDFAGEKKFSWLLQETQGKYPATLINELPLRIYFSFVPINGFFCGDLGYGVEVWDVVVFDPLNPPP